MQLRANTFHGLSGSFVMMILMDALSQMCLECQYEAMNYTLKEEKVLNWWSIAMKLALEETNRDGQKLKEKVMELESTLAMERHMFGNLHS
jgi:hypothetical protein